MSGPRTVLITHWACERGEGEEELRVLGVAVDRVDSSPPARLQGVRVEIDHQDAEPPGHQPLGDENPWRPPPKMMTSVSPSWVECIASRYGVAASENPARNAPTWTLKPSRSPIAARPMPQAVTGLHLT